jgi:hypothetical protein
MAYIVFKLASQSVAWNCSRRKPRSFTVRTGVAKKSIRTPKFDFLGYGVAQMVCSCKWTISAGAARRTR